MKNKGQLSTEYLVVLAVVVIIALIVLSVLAGFIDIGAGTSAQASKAYWRGADIGLMNWKVTANGSNSDFVVRNNQDYTIRLTSMKVGAVELLSSDVTIAAGKSVTVSEDLGTAGCTAGTPYSLGVAFTYDDAQHNINDISFTGTKNIDGSC